MRRAKEAPIIDPTPQETTTIFCCVVTDERLDPAELHDVIKDALKGELRGFRVPGFARGNLCDGGLCDFDGNGEEDGFAWFVASCLRLETIPLPRFGWTARLIDRTNSSNSSH